MSPRHHVKVRPDRAHLERRPRLDATGLSELHRPQRRFSVETFLPRPISKPDPAVYLHAAAQLDIDPQQGLTIEDSVKRRHLGVAAGHPTVGIIQFVHGRAVHVVGMDPPLSVSVDSDRRQIVRLELMLEDAWIKLSTVASSLTTVSARAILGAMVDGGTDARVLAEMAKGRMRKKIPDLAQAVEGTTSMFTCPARAVDP